jgi:glutamate-1-semialdehyde 2,1-aminomutase
MSEGQKLYRLAKTLIPGGVQLLSKRPEMFLPEHWPAYYRKAQGCSVWDLDGRELLDFSLMGVGSCSLGYADPDVAEAVVRSVRDGGMCTLNAPEEVELAKVLVDLHPWSGMVRFARTGGEAMTVAIRIARAATRRQRVLFCGYHGWHDWYLAANLSADAALDGHLLPGLEPRGVPRNLVDTALPFDYNDLDAFRRLVEENRDDIAAVVMEPIRNADPLPGFFETLRETCTREGIVLVVDEITAGFRLNLGGAHLTLGLEPDVAVFAKALGNGTPMAAVIGRSSVMQVAQESFISSTYWTERTGPVAALATLRKMKDVDLPAHLDRVGRSVMEGWRSAATQTGLPVEVGGIPPLAHFVFLLGDRALAAKTLFTQEMLRRGFLASTSCYACLAHTPQLVSRYLAACREVFAIVADGVAKDDLETRLDGPVCHSGFRRLT